MRLLRQVASSRAARRGQILLGLLPGDGVSQAEAATSSDRTGEQPDSSRWPRRTPEADREAAARDRMAAGERRNPGQGSGAAHREEGPRKDAVAQARSPDPVLPKCYRNRRDPCGGRTVRTGIRSSTFAWIGQSDGDSSGKRPTQESARAQSGGSRDVRSVPSSAIGYRGLSVPSERRSARFPVGTKGRRTACRLPEPAQALRGLAPL